MRKSESVQARWRNPDCLQFLKHPAFIPKRFLAHRRLNPPSRLAPTHVFESMRLGPVYPDVNRRRKLKAVGAVPLVKRLSLEHHRTQGGAAVSYHALFREQFPRA